MVKTQPILNKQLKHKYWQIMQNHTSCVLALNFVFKKDYNQNFTEKALKQRSSI